MKESSEYSCGCLTCGFAEFNLCSWKIQCSSILTQRPSARVLRIACCVMRDRGSPVQHNTVRMFGIKYKLAPCPLPSLLRTNPSPRVIERNWATVLTQKSVNKKKMKIPFKPSLLYWNVPCCAWWECWGQEIMSIWKFGVWWKLFKYWRFKYVRILEHGYCLHTHITPPGQKITKAIVRFAMWLTYFPFSSTLGGAAISFMMDIFVTFLLLFPVNLGQSRGLCELPSNSYWEKREKWRKHIIDVKMRNKTKYKIGSSWCLTLG